MQYRYSHCNAVCMQQRQLCACQVSQLTLQTRLQPLPEHPVPDAPTTGAIHPALDRFVSFRDRMLRCLSHTEIHPPGTPCNPSENPNLENWTRPGVLQVGSLTLTAPDGRLHPTLAWTRDLSVLCSVLVTPHNGYWARFLTQQAKQAKSLPNKLLAS